MFNKSKKLIGYMSILLMVNTVFAKTIELDITERGIINTQTNQLINNFIKKNDNVTSLYYFSNMSIDNSEFSINKATLLNSSQEECVIPVFKKQNNFYIQRVYCFNNIVSIKANKLLPTLYIGDFNNLNLRDFKPDFLFTTDKYSFGSEKIKNDLNFDNVPVHSIDGKSVTSLSCKISRKAFKEGNYEKLQCISDFEESDNLKQVTNKSPLYKSPSESSITKMYLIKGDKVEILEQKDNWLHIIYHGKKDIDAWIPKEAVK
jgi:hypothetical protein